MTIVNHAVIIMKRPKRKRVRRSYTKCHYPLSEVIQKINNGHVSIKPNALDDAYRLFGWESPEIMDAYRKLQPEHFIKTDVSRYIPRLAIDSYIATINGEIIYTHFYIDKSNFVVINSFHEP